MRATAVARIIACCSVLLLARPLAAQFDVQHDHLTCYRIKGQRITTTAVIDNQFGQEGLVQLTPALLCLPTQKTVTPPGVDPLPPTAVHHFKCYKVRRVKGTSLPDCTARLIKPTALLALLGGINCRAYSNTFSQKFSAGRT